jgi:hypothetical protein
VARTRKHIFGKPRFTPVSNLPLRREVLHAKNEPPE